MDGFTGLNIEKASHDIESFNQTCWEIQSKVRMPLKEFFIYLARHWASPVAKQFSDNICAKWEEVDSEYLTAFQHIVSGATDAGRALARANGLDLPNIINPGNVATADPIKSFISEDINGIVGMDVEGVRIALDAFKEQEKEGIALFDELPENIAFYDPNGELIGTYSRNVKNFKTKFQEIINTVITEMEGYLETETDNILLAKQNANDTLNA